jgi:ubiquinone/menaquinone biosynthesis C-methylase UbiE
MSDEREIYENSPARYHDLVSHEDYEGKILPAIERIQLLTGLDVVELGAGTGRLTRQLIPMVKSIRAFDIAAPMLRVAAENLRANGCSNWSIAVGSHRAVPVEDASADLVISGWSVCYAVVNHPDDWETELAAVLAEAERILRPGGTIILLETLGVGQETPSPPSHLVPYFDYLERVGFSRTWFRTDFRFDTPEQADDLIRFFFGDKIADETVEAENAIVPECTGLFWKEFS